MYDTKDLYDLLSVFPTQAISRPDEEKNKNNPKFGERFNGINGKILKGRILTSRYSYHVWCPISTMLAKNKGEIYWKIPQANLTKSIIIG